MSLFAKINEAGAVVEFPIYEHQLRRAFPNISFPAVMVVPPAGYVAVQDTPQPVINQAIQKIEDGGAAKIGVDYKRVWNIVALTAEELLANAKVVRLEAVQSIQVETASGKIFDGDESAQDRMSRAIVALDPAESTTWILADNTPALVTREELREALRLAGAEMTAHWVVPYQ